MKTKIMRIATMAAMMMAAMSMAEAQEAANGQSGTRYTGGPCLPSIHAMEDHQGAWCYIDQITTLEAGWNWWSTHIEVTLDELKAALVDAMPGTNNIVIKSQSNGQATYNGSTWRGQLTELDVRQMYKIKTQTDGVMTLTGAPINPVRRFIVIVSGASWIGFPLGANMNLNNAFAGFAANGDMVKSQGSGNSTYQGTWRGVLKNLVPGQGYIYKSNVQDSRVLTFPSGAK